MFCDKLFKGIEEKAGSGTQFEVKFSMLEIYNEVCTFYVLFVAPLGNANSALLHFNREKPSLHEKN